jgi:hypothetical protein
MKTLKISGNSADIRYEHFPNTKVYRYVNLLGSQPFMEGPPGGFPLEFDFLTDTRPASILSCPVELDRPFP